MASPGKKSSIREFARFLLVGTSNTVFSYVLYWWLLKLLPYLFAYSLAYAAGVVLSYVLNSRFVFREAMSLQKFLQFPVVYVIQYGLGAGVLWLLVGQLSVPPEWAMLAVVVVTIPVTFLASRFILKR